MKFLIFLGIIPFFTNCQPAKEKVIIQIEQQAKEKEVAAIRTYEEVKKTIEARRKEFSIKYNQSDSIYKHELLEKIKDYWISTINMGLYAQWKDTPWDFNGATTKPGQGNIACGFFVATLLQDMGLKVNRRKLSVVTSSQLMKSLAPNQPLKNLSHLDYPGFNQKLNEYGKGVYIIGLDFHTGFIVNDGHENWFIHSNYIARKGVTKETVMQSQALVSSDTRWMISLTGDDNFLKRWLNN